MNAWKIAAVDSSETTGFAVAEFCRLMKKLDPRASVSTVSAEEASVKIGLSSELPCPEVENPKLDDAISISVKSGCGYITGANERSVLIAVYRFFREAGVSFIRPGRWGEIIPERDSYEIEVSLAEKPAARYRGVCLEGSVGYEHILDTVDFLPKLGMNSFFTQLWLPTFAFDRWYGNERSPARTPMKLSTEAQAALVADYDRAIRMRGLQHHKMGHGWIPSILGEKTGLWHAPSADGLLKEEDRHLVAEIGGKRELMGGSAVDSSFCYSNPEARSKIVEEVVKYAKANPEVDMLHVWLADQPNNQCECENCRNTLPSDFYIDMLNELDSRLTEEGLETRIIFLAYLELFWTPAYARLKNQERFILLFAPIRRPYEEPLSAQRRGETVPFRRNDWSNPCSTFSALKYLDEWKKQFKGDCVLFDYHLMWDLYNDVVGEDIAKLLATDMVELPECGMQGMISCQNLRVGIVGALSMRLMANALWTGKSNAEEEINEFYTECYGADAEKVKETLRAVREAIIPNMLRGITPAPENYDALCAAAKAKIKELEPTLNAHSRDANFTLRVSYLYLGEELMLASRLMDFLMAAIKGDSAGAKKIWAGVLTAIAEIEALYPDALDSFEFALVWHRHILPLYFPDWKIDYASGELTM